MSRFCDLIDPWKSFSDSLRWVDEGDNWKVSRVRLEISKTPEPGLFLRVKCPRSHNGYGFLLQTEFQPTDNPRDAFGLERVEWKVGHTNRAVGPSELHFMEIDSTHYHRFDINYVSEHGRMRARNLPLAVPIAPDPRSLEEFLDCAEKLLRIKGVSEISRPMFQGRLVS